MTSVPVFTSVHALTLASLVPLMPPALPMPKPRRAGPFMTRQDGRLDQEGQVYRIVTSLTQVTTVEFGQGETIRSIIAGDTVGFQFDGVPGGQAFAIKPVARGVTTNITVYTNRRSYYFHVVEARETPHCIVQFRYPEAAYSDPRGRGLMRQMPTTPSAQARSSRRTLSGMTAPSRISALRRNAQSRQSSATNGGRQAVNSTALEDGVIRLGREPAIDHVSAGQGLCSEYGRAPHREPGHRGGHNRASRGA